MIFLRFGFCGFDIRKGEADFTPRMREYTRKESSTYWEFKLGILQFVRMGDWAFSSVSEALRGLDKDPDWIIKNRHEVDKLVEKARENERKIHEERIKNLRNEVSEIHEKLGKVTNENYTLRKAFEILDKEENLYEEKDG